MSRILGGVRVLSILLSAGMSLFSPFPCANLSSPHTVHHITPQASRSQLLTNPSQTQPRKRTRPPRNPLAHARTPLDGRNAEQESEYAAFLSAGVGLEGLKRSER